MSGVLANAVKDLLRGAFSKQLVSTVDLYGGQFNATEVDYTGFSCPAVLVALLGWQPRPDRGNKTVDVRMAAFVVTKHARRDERMLEAATLAEAVSLVLRDWKPNNIPGGTVYRLDEAPSAENLYSRAVDAKGLALWLVSWEQTFVPPSGVNVADLYELLRVDITDTTQQGVVPAAPAPPTGLVVTEEVKFKTPI